ncbi:MAG: urease accessory protein UreF [Deltaproteobacteria bacterium]|jgi:urease accessory protein|nr:urease accessory protein UreF [Deltaproteobacteria bacterium]MBT6435320.1 urease accessory protein UreF [Deltaproteobacteria bacterium]MBT6488167.1 urease accessory protein UreF [Deltaproteobacteria bacterium]
MLTRLMQLVSPTLPVGAFAYSQGLEHAVHLGWVHDVQSAHTWIAGIAHEALVHLDLPVFYRLYDAWQVDDEASVTSWNELLLAGRESSELQNEDHHMGIALARLLSSMDIVEANDWTRPDGATSWVTMFALAAQRWGIAKHDAALGFCWSWAENQVAAAVKLVPLGQTDGQRVLWKIGESIVGWAEQAAEKQTDEIGSFLPGLAVSSALHETQYSRLFRS